MKMLLDLYITFAQIGLVAFGGAYAILPILEDKLVNKKQWVSKEDLLNYFSIGQCAPGIISVNVAVIIAYKHKGIAGSIAATLGLITAPFAIITIIAAFLQNFAELQAVKNAFAGIRVCVCVLIVNSVISMWKRAVSDRPAIVIFAAVLILALFTNISAVLLVIASGVAGVVISAVRRASAK